MKTVTEVRETASKKASGIAAATKKIAYAAIGAPSVAKKRIASEKWRKNARKEFGTWVTEGERLTGQVRDAKVVEDLKDKVDMENLQGRVEKLRDQLEDVLSNWKDTFKPETKPETEPAAKPAPKKTATKKTAAKASAKKTAATKKDSA